MNVPAKTTSEIRRSFLNNFRRRLMDVWGWALRRRLALSSANAAPLHPATTQLFDSILRTVDRVEADKDRRRREEEQRAREVQAERERSAWEVQQRAAAATLGGTGGAKGSGGGRRGWRDAVESS